MSENLTAFRQILAKVGKQKLDKREQAQRLCSLLPCESVLQVSVRLDQANPNSAKTDGKSFFKLSRATVTS